MCSIAAAFMPWFFSIGRNAHMITALHSIDYQHAAEELVGIERKRLSVFVLHGLKRPI
jgi:hypothetical protein